MNKIKTLLVDDEPRGLSALQKLLEFNCPEIEIVGTSGSADEAKEKIELLKPDLVFLDIAMPEKDGFDLLNEISPISFEIIFVTAHNDFMLQAFRFSAVDYLLKPVEHNLLVDAVKRAAKRIEEKTSGGNLEALLYNMRQKEVGPKMKLCITSIKGFQVVRLSDIIYCEASSNYTNFHFTDKSMICASRPIHEFEEMLEDCHFVRTHKSTLVNLEHVKEYIRGEGGTVVMSNGRKLEVSRRKKESFMNKMKEYYKY
jgi:two-component system LytT family response regulator